MPGTLNSKLPARTLMSLHCRRPEFTLQIPGIWAAFASWSMTSSYPLGLRLRESRHLCGLCQVRVLAFVCWTLRNHLRKKEELLLLAQLALETNQKFRLLLGSEMAKAESFSLQQALSDSVELHDLFLCCASGGDVGKVGGAPVLAHYAFAALEMWMNIVVSRAATLLSISAAEPGTEAWRPAQCPICHGGSSSLRELEEHLLSHIKKRVAEMTPSE
eukprot:RCo043144